MESQEAILYPIGTFRDLAVRQDRFSLREYVLFQGALALGLGILFANVAVGVVSFLSALFLLLFYRPRVHRLDALMTASFFAIAAVLLVYFGNVETYGSGYYLGGSDDFFFERTTREAIAYEMYTIRDLREGMIIPTRDYGGFLIILSWVMRFCDLFGGYHTVCFNVMNVNLWIAVALMISAHYRKHFPENGRTAQRIFLMTALFPNALYISAHVFRDTIGIFLIVLMYTAWDMFFKRTQTLPNRLAIILLTIPALYIGYWVRKFNFFFILIVIALSFVFKETNNKKRHTLTCVLLVLVALPIAIYQFDLINLLKKYNTNYTNYLLRINPGISNQIFSLPLFPLGIFLRTALGMFVPAPFQIFWPVTQAFTLNNIVQAIVGVGTIVQLYGLPSILRGFRPMKKMAVTFLAALLVIVVTTFTFRHFITIYPFMIPLLQHGWATLPYEKRRASFIVFSMLIGLVLIAYVAVN